MSCGDCPKFPSMIVHGVVGLTKAALHIDRASDAVIAERRDQCRNCNHATKRLARAHLPTKGLTNLSRCLLCRCNIAAKTMIAGESCPGAKWKITANAR